MTDTESNISSLDKTQFPPGTARLADKSDLHLVLSPQPTNDPNDPLNWSSRRKFVQIVLLCMYGIFTYGFLTVSPVIWYNINADLGFDYTTLNNSYGTSAATLSIGCICFTPFALRFGRRPVYLATSIVLIAGEIWSAKMQTPFDIYFTNGLMGLAGSVNEVLFQMTVSDLFFVHQRGTLNGVFYIFSTLGNYFAPVAGGYIAEYQDWRWCFWYLAIFQGATLIAMTFFLEESKYAPDNIAGLVNPSRLGGGANQINATRSLEDGEKLAKAVGEKSDPTTSVTHQVIVSEMDGGRLVPIDHSISMRPLKRRYALWNSDGSGSSSYEWWRHFTQPFVLIATIPAAGFAAIQWAFCLAALSLVAVATADLYAVDPYNFTSIGIGNLNIAPAIGSILGAIYGGPFTDWTVVNLARRNGGIYEPEMRLVPFVFPAIMMPIGVFMYGLCTAEGQAWIIPTIGSGFIGFAIAGVGDIALTYLQDSYTEILPDALVGVAFVRNVLAMILVFVIQPWFDGMGVYNAFVMLGCFAVGFSLLGIPMRLFGKRARVACQDRYRKYAGKQFVVRAL